jgi:hypothetical protein
MLNHKAAGSYRSFPPYKHRYNHFDRNLHRYEDNISAGMKDSSTHTHRGVLCAHYAVFLPEKKHGAPTAIHLRV